MNLRGIIGAALALAGCHAAAPPPAAAPPAATPTAAAPTADITIALATVAPADGVGSISLTGTVRLKRETQLAFSTSGRIATIGVLEGQRVGVGQPLAALDPTGLNAATASARAEAARADADRARMQSLLAKGWVTRTRMETADAAAAAARSRVTQTGFDARLGRLVAPAAGVVLRRSAEPGQMVATGTPIVTIGELGSGYVLRLAVSDVDLARFRLGQHAEVLLPALSPTPMAATVGEIAARGDDRTGTFQVELRLPDRPGLRSGLIGTASLGSAAAVAGPVAVPASAVVGARADEGLVYVYRPATGTVVARVVQLGAVGDHAVTVTGGLAPGERVAQTGVDRLRDGMKVRLAQAASAS